MPSDVKYKGFIREKKFTDYNPLSTIQQNEIVIYGIKGDNLYFQYIQANTNYLIKIENIREQISCKFIRSSRYVCSYFINEKMYVSSIILRYISRDQSQLTILENIEVEECNNYDNLILYDTDEEFYKILCCTKKITKEKKCSIIYAEVIVYLFITSITKNLNLIELNTDYTVSLFKTHNCYLNCFKDEFLLCCGESNNINCFRNNINNFSLINKFSITLSGSITNIIITNKPDHVIISYKNETSIKNYLYNYYIYPPQCKNVYQKINSFQIFELNLSELFEKDTNTEYYISFPELPNKYGIIKIGEKEISSTNSKIELKPEKEKLYFISKSYQALNNYDIDFQILIKETYSSKCKISLTVKECYYSCRGCIFDINNSNFSNHSCINCREDEKYFPYSEKPNNCYKEQEMEKYFKDWYFNERQRIFENYESVFISNNDSNNGTQISCMNGNLYFYKGKCIKDCPYGTFGSQDDSGNKICENCYPNCADCKELGNSTDMKCSSCSENQIKYKQNCHFIYDNEIDKFYNPDNNEIVSCLQFYNKYLIENTKECIDKPERGYFILNNITGLLSPCHFSCRTCSNKMIDDNSNCIECANDYFPIYGENLNNCYSNETIYNGYYLAIKNDSFIWKKCYEICDECYDEGNSTNMNCLSCKDLSYNLSSSYIYNLTENNNCIKNCKRDFFMTSKRECVKECPNGTYQYDLNNTCLESCPIYYEQNEEQNKCVKISYDKISHTEFKDLFLNDMNKFLNSSALINGSDFLVVVLSSDDINLQEQINHEISSFDFGSCTEEIKEYYNISKNESLIILNMEIKRNETKINEEKNFNKNIVDVGKTSQIEIYDKSGSELDLSVCNQKIKIMKYIGDLIDELNLNLAKKYANNGIDIFDPNDKYFNSICHEYNNNDGKDIAISDRIADIYKNVIFCEKGCSYEGINYDLLVANCICDSSIMKSNMDNNNSNIYYNKVREKINFDSIKKSFIANLFDFNLDALYCYNLVFNIKILKNNIGFYCLFMMFIIQLICFFIYLFKKLKPIKYYMLIFNSRFQKVSAFFPPPIQYNNNLTLKRFDKNQTKKSSKNNAHDFFSNNQFSKIRLNKNENDKKLENNHENIINKKNYNKKLDKEIETVDENEMENKSIFSKIFLPSIDNELPKDNSNNEIQMQILDADRKVNIPFKEIKIENKNIYNIKTLNNVKQNKKILKSNNKNKIIRFGKKGIFSLETIEGKKNMKNIKQINKFLPKTEQMKIYKIWILNMPYFMIKGLIGEYIGHF